MFIIVTQCPQTQVTPISLVSTHSVLARQTKHSFLFLTDMQNFVKETSKPNIFYDIKGNNIKLIHLLSNACNFAGVINPIINGILTYSGGARR